MRWVWDEKKNAINRQRHGIGFETAQLVFDDPLVAMWRDPCAEEERWQAVGMIGSKTVFVVHTWPTQHFSRGDEVGRIISARLATKHERKRYEEEGF